MRQPRLRWGNAGRPFYQLLLLACALGVSALASASGSKPANAQYGYSPYFPGGAYWQGYRPPQRRYYRRNKVRRSFPKAPAKPPEWFTKEESKDPVHVIVSLPKQQLTVYRGDKALTTSKVSSGKPGYSTPAGVFSILEQKVRHFSNIYRGAPMPFMQRLTWSGIALHASNSVPNRPASHGCVRLPPSFAGQLFKITKRGGHVVIANEEDVVPTEIAHDNLFQPVSVPPKDFDIVEAERTARLAGIKVVEEKRSTKPVRILVTRRTGRELFMEVQSMLNELSFGAGDVDGWMGPDTAQAIRRFQATYGLEKNGLMSPELVAKLYEVLDRGEPLNGHLYVRQNFKPVFDVPVLIKDGDKPLGSHMFTAMHFEPGDEKTRWLSVTLTKGSGKNAAYGRIAKKKKKKDETDDVVLTEAPPEASSAQEALSRIVIPGDVRERISKMLNPGSSLAITNDGISRETTPKGTDFIVLMQ